MRHVVDDQDVVVEQAGRAQPAPARVQHHPVPRPAGPADERRHQPRGIGVGHAAEPEVDRGGPGGQERRERGRQRPGRVGVAEPVAGDVHVVGPVRRHRDHARAEPVEDRRTVVARPARPRAAGQPGEACAGPLPVQRRPERPPGQRLRQPPRGLVQRRRWRPHGRQACGGHRGGGGGGLLSASRGLPPSFAKSTPTPVTIAANSRGWPPRRCDHACAGPWTGPGTVRRRRVNRSPAPLPAHAAPGQLALYTAQPRSGKPAAVARRAEAWLSTACR